jgi:hypothetical protein
MKVSLLSIVLLGLSLVSFSQTPVLSGTIRDAENKQPLSGATVKVVRGKDSLSVVSDKTGTFEFKNLVDTGRYDLVISFLGYELTRKRSFGKMLLKNWMISILTGKLKLWEG